MARPTAIRRRGYNGDRGGRARPVVEGSRREPSWPEPLVRFVQLVNEGCYWAAHEALEQGWRQNRSDFFHGLIVYASAFVHAWRGNPRGVLLQLGKVGGYLRRYPPAYLGVDVEAVLRHADETAARVQEAGMPEGAALWAAIRWPRLTLDPARLLGSEGELAAAATHAGAPGEPEVTDGGPTLAGGEARAEAGEERVACPRCGRRARYVGACLRCEHCGFQGACGEG